MVNTEVNCVQLFIRYIRLVAAHMLDKLLRASVYVMLATVPGDPAAVRVWNRTIWSSPGCYPENNGNQRVRGRVRTGL